MSIFREPRIPHLTDAPLVAVAPRLADSVHYFVHGDSWYVLADAYWDAGERLLDVVEKERESASALLAPALFLIRHSVELFLKSQISDATSMTFHTLEEAEKKIFDQHSLRRLWVLLEHSLLRIGGVKHDAWWQRTASIVTQLDDFDPTSFAFRYPTDKRNSGPTRGGSDFVLDIRQFRSVLGELHLILSGTSAWLEELNGASPY